MPIHCCVNPVALIPGALWNFPGSGPPVWHRDGQDELLVAVTAPRDYPETVGFIHGQPQTHLGALQGMSPGQTLGWKRSDILQRILMQLF